MSIETPKGWVKPQRPRTLVEVKELIKAKKEELAALELEAYNIEQGPRLEAIAKINNIMRAQQLTLADIIN